MYEVPTQPPNARLLSESSPHLPYFPCLVSLNAVSQGLVVRKHHYDPCRMGVLNLVQGRRQALGAHPNEIRWGEFFSRSPAPHRADFDRINQATRHLVSCSKFYKLLHDEGLGILTPCLACCIVAIRLFNPIVGRKCDAG